MHRLDGPKLRELLADPFEAAAQGVDRGEFFEYALDAPVSLRRSGAALVPLFSAPVAACRRRLWREGCGRNPDIVLDFANTTDAVLEEGAAVVYEDGCYAGEAMLRYAARGAPVRLAFAKDPAMRLRSDESHRHVTTGLNLAPATVVEQRWLERHQTIGCENDHDEAVEVWIEIPKSPPWELDPAAAQPVEDGQDAWTFRLAVPARGRASLKLVQRRRDAHEFRALGFETADLERWLAGRFLDQRTRGALEKLLAARTRRFNLHKELETISKARDEVHDAQQKISAQLGVLKEGGREGALRLRYVDELAAAQDRLNAHGAEHARLKAAIEANEKDAAELIAALVKTAS